MLPHTTDEVVDTADSLIKVVLSCPSASVLVTVRSSCIVTTVSSSVLNLTGGGTVPDGTPELDVRKELAGLLAALPCLLLFMRLVISLLMELSMSGATLLFVMAVLYMGSFIIMESVCWTLIPDGFVKLELMIFSMTPSWAKSIDKKLNGMLDSFSRMRSTPWLTTPASPSMNSTFSSVLPATHIPMRPPKSRVISGQSGVHSALYLSI